MTAPIQKTVVVIHGPTGPTGTIKGINILSAFTGTSGATGTGHAAPLPQWLQATGATGGKGILEKVYNIGPTGVTGQHKTVIIRGFVGPTGG